MIPQYIEGLDSFSAAARIQGLEEFMDRLQLENLDQTLTINKIKQHNNGLIRQIDSIHMRCFTSIAPAHGARAPNRAISNS